MIERITKNEERLDKALNSVNKMIEALDDFKKNEKNIKLVSKYYGSNNWFKDKESYEKGIITNVKAGVLSEDAVWNMLSDIEDVILDMKEIITRYENIKS